MVLSDRAQRSLSALDRILQLRIAKALRRLEVEPRRDPQVRRLTGSEQYRLRVGDYRILFEIEDDRLLVVVIEMGHRREVYR